MVIVLIGYMGSGKSTIGKELASKLNYVFRDLDHYIQKKENLSIPEIFNTKGEIYFRKKEAEYLRHIIASSNDNMVLSLGGGTPCYAENMDFLLASENIITVYLKATLDELVTRLYKEKENRPLISHLHQIDGLKDFIRKHLFERTPIYEQSLHKVVIGNTTPYDMVESIILKLY